MKKLILLIIILAGWQFSKAQTVEETVEFITVKLFQAHFVAKPVATGESLIQPKSWLIDGEFRKISVGSWASIKSINYFKDSDGYWKLDLSGAFTIYDYSSKGLDFSYQDLKFDKLGAETRVVIIFPPNTSETDVQKLIKALKHLAVLKGAKLVKDDLF